MITAVDGSVPQRPSDPPDYFFVGAHAQARAQALLTRDRGFYRRCFEPLRVIEPEPSS